MGLEGFREGLEKVQRGFRNGLEGVQRGLREGQILGRFLGSLGRFMGGCWFLSIFNIFCVCGLMVMVQF